MEKRLSCNISIHEEEMDGKKVFVTECSELGISDFGDSVADAMNNLKKAIALLLEEAPEKRKLLDNPEPVMVTRLFL